MRHVQLSQKYVTLRATKYMYIVHVHEPVYKSKPSPSKLIHARVFYVHVHVASFTVIF